MTRKQLAKMQERQRRYMAAPGAPYNNEQAQSVGEEFEKMEKEGVAVTPSTIVLRAAPETSTLHSYFTWDNAVAADNFRKWEARSLVNHLIVVTPHGEGEKRQKSHYSCTISNEDEDTEQPDREYLSVQVVQREEALRRQVHVKAWSELKAWAARWEHFAFDDLEVILDLVASRSK